MRAVVCGHDEHEGLDDLAQLGAEGRCGVRRGVGRLGEGRDLDRDALALRGVADASNRGVVRLIGHRRSLAPGLRRAVEPGRGQ